MAKLSREEFMDKYSQQLVTFSHYYKYTFTYQGTLSDGSVITVGYGGDSNEIYRHEVVPNVEETIEGLWPYEGQVIKDGVVVEEFYDY